MRRVRRVRRCVGFHGFDGNAQKHRHRRHCGEPTTFRQKLPLRESLLIHNRAPQYLCEFRVQCFPISGKDAAADARPAAAVHWDGAKLAPPAAGTAELWLTTGALITDALGDYSSESRLSADARCSTEFAEIQESSDSKSDGRRCAITTSWNGPREWLTKSRHCGATVRSDSKRISRKRAVRSQR